MLTVSEEFSSIFRLDQLTVEMDRVLNCLVLNWHNFHPKNNLFKEKLSQNVVTRATKAYNPLKAEVDSILHDLKASLAPVSLQSV